LAKDTWPLFTSDALRHYAHVLLEAFGVWQRPAPTGKPGRPRKPVRVPHPLLGSAQVDKRRQAGRVVEVKRRIVFGLEKDVVAQAQGLRCANGRKGKVNTAYVERQNLSLREENGRLSRKTLAFSKNRRDLSRDSSTSGEPTPTWFVHTARCACQRPRPPSRDGGGTELP